MKDRCIKMIEISRLKKEIREIFSTYTKELVVNFDERHLQKLTKDAQEVLMASFISVYIYDVWNDQYKPVSSAEDSNPFTLDEFTNHIIPLVQQETGDPYIIFNQKDEKVLIMKHSLEQLTKPTYSVIKYNQDFFTESFINFLVNETNQFIEIYISCFANNREMTCSHLLNQLSDKIYTTSNRRKALTYFFEYFEKAYPFLTHEIMLSQDYKVKCDLPVRELNIDHDHLRLIDEAFLTGEIMRNIDGDQIELYLPLKGNQGIYGVLSIETKRKNLPEREITMLRKFAKTCGQALENVSLYQHSMNSVANLKIINQATNKFNANTDISSLTKIVMEYIIDASEAEEVGVVFFEGDSLRDDITISEHSTEFFKREDGRMFLRYLEEHCEKNSRVFSGSFTNYVESSPFESVMALPMVHTGERMGCIIIAHRENYFFSFDTYKLLQSLVQNYTLAISNTVLRNKLEKAVITDYLTKLYARNYLDERAQEHIKSGENGLLVLFDIDDFKAINDSYGHSVGDQVLIQVANILKQYVSKEDIAARWGGEELALYLPDKTLEEGMEIAENILSQVEEQTEPKVTLSCGIASWEAGRNYTVRELFNEADQALYLAKFSGKNQIRTNEKVR